MDTLLRIFALLMGVLIVLITLFSVIRTFVLPRSARDKISAGVFVVMRRVFGLFIRHVDTYEERDSIMALYAPITLLLLPIVWLALVTVGYMLMYWATEGMSMGDAYRLSGSSLLTLGFATINNTSAMLLEFSEAALGLILIALLIGYLPTMYSAFSRRETSVTLLEVRAGQPPSAVTMLIRFQRLNRLEALHDMWASWEVWFADLEETHTSLAALNFFRSPRPGRSWVTAAGIVLDSAALFASSLDVPRDTQADLSIRSGYLALRHICDFFRIPYDPEPKADDPISITRAEFEEALDQMAEAGVPIRADRDQAWRDYAGWRVNYDTPLLALAALTMAPYAAWVSDRSLQPRLSPARRALNRAKARHNARRQAA